MDRFRLKIWDTTTGTVVYDNQPDDTDDAVASDAIEGGSIVIHGTKPHHSDERRCWRRGRGESLTPVVRLSVTAARSAGPGEGPAGRAPRSLPVEPDGVGLVVEAGSAYVHGRRVLNQAFVGASR